jgi:transcriptional regulator with XRE-family HTH domain
MTNKDRIKAGVETAIAAQGGREPLARYLGVTPNAITEWRKGRATPNAEHMLKMMDLLRRRSPEYTF